MTYRLLRAASFAFLSLVPACGARIVPVDPDPDAAVFDGAAPDGAVVEDGGAFDASSPDVIPGDRAFADEPGVEGACSDELYMGSVGRTWSAELLRLGPHTLVAWTPTGGGVALQALRGRPSGVGRAVRWSVPTGVDDAVHTASWIDRGIVAVGGSAVLVRADDAGDAVLGATRSLEGRAVRGVGISSELLARVALDNGAMGYVGAMGSTVNLAPAMGLVPGVSVVFPADGFTAWTPTADGASLTGRAFIVGHGSTIELTSSAITLRGRSASPVRGDETGFYRIVQEGEREVSLRLEAISTGIPPTAHDTRWRVENVAWNNTTAAVRPAGDGAVIAWAAHPVAGGANGDVQLAWSDGGAARTVASARDGTNARVLDVMAADDGATAWVLYAGAFQNREGLFARCVRRVP